mmetsp:Transcript_34669/g.83756  ORF Transcript_34669/g.83756 Transcript_34669/m.83756 type:complete len:328 (+) Transcript_34669:573-1556(+)
MALDIPCVGLHVTHQQLQQCGFSAPVLPHHGIPRPHLHVHIQVGQPEPAAVARLRLRIGEAHLVHLHQIGDRLRILEGELQGGVLGDLFQHGEPLQGLDAGLYQARTLSVAPEGVDELAQVGLGPLLGLRLPLLLEQLIRSHFFEGVVVPLVVRELLVPELNDVRADGIQEIPGVGHNDQGGLALRQVLLQPGHRVQIQVIGGLIQQQEVRVGEKRASQGHTHAPSSREMAEGLGLHMRGQPQPRQDLRSLVGGGGRVHLLEPLVDCGEASRILSVRGLGMVHPITEDLLLGQQVPPLLIHHEHHIQSRNQVLGQMVQLLLHGGHHQ